MKITVDTDKAYRKIRKLKNMDRAVRYQMNLWGGRTVKRIIRNISGRILKTRTGQLRRSVAFRSLKVGTKEKIEIGTGIRGRSVKYARIHEKGGKIRAKRAKMLTIPLPGVKGMARNYPNAFIITSKKGNVLLVERKGKTGIRPLFKLQKEVDIPARNWLSDSIEETKPQLFRFLKPSELIRVMNKMGG